MTTHLQGMLKKNLSIKVNGSLWIECDGKKYFGPGPMELLERIEETGSINKAARQTSLRNSRQTDGSVGVRACKKGSRTLEDYCCD